MQVLKVLSQHNVVLPLKKVWGVWINNACNTDLNMLLCFFGTVRFWKLQPIFENENLLVSSCVQPELSSGWRKTGTKQQHDPVGLY